jgi:hypothetical protein
MNSRVYLLLDILEEKFPYAKRKLQNTRRVAAVDELEGHPNMIVIIEAPDRQQLVEILMPVLESVERITNDVHLLVSQATGMTQFYSADSAIPFEKREARQTMIS